MLARHASMLLFGFENSNASIMLMYCASIMLGIVLALCHNNSILAHHASMLLLSFENSDASIMLMYCASIMLRIVLHYAIITAC
jgi:hypothetical protein